MLRKAHDRQETRKIGKEDTIEKEEVKTAREFFPQLLTSAEFERCHSERVFDLRGIAIGTANH